MTEGTYREIKNKITALELESMELVSDIKKKERQMPEIVLELKTIRKQKQRLDMRQTELKKKEKSFEDDLFAMSERKKFIKRTLDKLYVERDIAREKEGKSRF